jgi:hypothetical protein
VDDDGHVANFVETEQLIQIGEHTDKKENKIFLIDKEIHKGSVAKSYMTEGLVIYD